MHGNSLLDGNRWNESKSCIYFYQLNSNGGGQISRNIFIVMASLLVKTSFFGIKYTLLAVSESGFYAGKPY